MWNWILRLLLWPFAFLAALAVAAYFLIQYEPVQQFAAQHTLAFVNREIAGSIQLERVGLTLDGRVALRDFALFSDGGEQLLSAKRLHARVAPWDLVFGKLHLYSVKVEELRGVVEIDSTGDNITAALATPPALEPDTTYTPLWLRLNRVNLDIDSVVVLIDSSFSYTARDWNVLADALITDSVITYVGTIEAKNQFTLSSNGVVRPYSDSLFAGDVEVSSTSQYLKTDWLPDFPDLGAINLTARGDVLKRDLMAVFDVSVEKVGHAKGDLEILNFADSARVSLGAQFRNIDLAYWVGDSVAHQLNGRAALTKSPSPEWTHDWFGRVELDSSYYGTIEVVADLEAQLFESAASVAGAVQSNAGSFELRVHSDGLSADSLDLSGRAMLSGAQLQAFVPEIPDSLSPLSGLVDFSFEQGPGSKLSADAKVALGSLSFGRYALDSLTFAATLDGTNFTLDSTRLRIGSASSLLFANGDYTDRISAVISLNVPKIEEFRDLLVSFTPQLDSLGGDLRAELTAELAFNDDSLSNVIARGKADFDRFTYGTYSASGVSVDVHSVETAAELFTAQIAVDSLNVFDESVTPIMLALDGSWFTPEFTCSLSVRHDTLELAAVGRIDLASTPLLIEIDTLSLNLFGTSWANDFPIELSLDSSHYEVGALILRSDFGVLRATGYLEQPGTQDIVLEFSGLQTGKLTPILRTEVPDGNLNLRLQLSGPDTAITGNIEMLLDAVTYQESQLADRVRLVGTVADGSVTADLDYIWQNDTALTIHASLPASLSIASGLIVSKGDSLQGTMRIDSLPLSRFQPWMTQGIRVEGSLSANLALSGSAEQPDWSGTLHLDNGFFGDNRHGIAYKWILLDADLLRDSLRINTLRATSRGTVTGSGFAKLGVPWPESLSLDLHFDKFEAFSSRIQKARLDGNLFVGGPFDSLNVDGNLTVQEGFYRITQSATKDIELVNIDSVLAGLRGDTLTEGFDPDAFYNSLAHDLNVKIPGNFWIRGNGMNLELFGELRVEKAHNELPTANGEILIRKGKVKFYGQELRIQENSSLRFDGPPEVPDLNITAIYSGIDKSRGPFEVTVTLTGTPDQSKAEFSGQFDNGTAMSQEEAIQRLLPFVGNTGGSAEQAVADAASGQVSEIVGKASGLDVFEFRPGEGGLSDLSSAQLEIGTYVTDRLFIRVFQPIEDPRSGQKVSIDYRLLDWMKFTAEQTTAEQGRPSSSFTVYLQFEWR